MGLEKLVKKVVSSVLIASTLATFSLIGCSKNPTAPNFENVEVSKNLEIIENIKYKEPVKFEIFEYSHQKIPQEFIDFCKNIWDYELRADKKIKENTWEKGNYTVFVYQYGKNLDTYEYNELLFFTTTEPIGNEKQVYSTVTPFRFEHSGNFKDCSAEKIKTYVFVNDYKPIESEEEAKEIMRAYLDEYNEKYPDYGINYIKEYLEEQNYILDYADHYIFYEPPSDLGGAIIINKKTSKLDFLGTDIWMGYSIRFFPKY